MRFKSNVQRCLGFTTIEMVVALLGSSLLLTASVASLTMFSHILQDSKIEMFCQTQAQAVLDTMTPEIRMMGNGVPFHQANFLIAQEGLAYPEVTQPVLVNATDTTSISFRVNETGNTYILAADFDPASSSIVTLTDVSGLSVGDEIYITNSTVSADDGLWGIIYSINTTTKKISIKSGVTAPLVVGGAVVGPATPTPTPTPSSPVSPQHSLGATFATGSLLEKVSVVTYESLANYGGITRDAGAGAEVLVPNGQFTLTHLNKSGPAITLPLVASSADPFPASAIQNLRSVRVTVQVRSESRLSSGSYFVATAEQSVGIRNLNFKY